VGFIQGTTWGTPVAVGAGRGLRLRSFDDSGGGHEPLPREDIGDAYGSKFDKGGERRSVTLSGDAYYGGNVFELWAYMFGTSGAPTNNTGSYTHTLTMTDAIAKFLTLCAGKRSSQKPWEYDSMIAQSLTIRGAGAGRVTYEIIFLGGTLDTASSTNTATEIQALTTPTLQQAMKFTDGVFRMNAASGSGLVAGDAFVILDFELSIARPLTEDFGTGSASMLQPCEDGPAADVMLSVTLRDYNTEQFITWWNGVSEATSLKGDLIFSSGLTPASGLELTATFQFPELVVANEPDAPISGPTRIPHTIRFKCFEASSAPTGMSGVTKPVHLVVEDTDSSAYLA